MGLATLQGGTHPFEGEGSPMDRAVTALKPISGEMVYPLSQHIGVPAKAIVKVGDEALVGQKIAEAGDSISVVVVNSVSEKVKKTEPRVIVGGAKSISIAIENDGQYTAVEGLSEDRDATRLSKQEIRDIMREAGIVGLGGTGFPTNVKLTSKDEPKIDYIIVNDAECEPYLTCNYRMMIEESEWLIGGFKVMLQSFENAKVVIGVENNKPRAIEKLRALVKDEPKIPVEALRTKYPQGGECSLIYAVTDREINSSMFPVGAGYVVDNVNMVMAIYDVVCKRTPILERVITIMGDAIKELQNFKVRIGMNHNDIIEAAGDFKVGPEKIPSGDPMTGQAMYTADVSVIKNSSSLTCFLEDEVEKNPENPCIRRGRCGEVYLEFLVPVLIMKSCMNGDSVGYEELYGMECIECGSYSYIYPARRPLTQVFKQMKRRIGEERRQRAVAEKAASGKETKQAMNVLNVSASPHVRDRTSMREIMLDVCIAMIPTTVYDVAQFGTHSLLVILVTILTAVLSEYFWQCGMKKEATITDCSAVVTGLILTLNMPPEIPLWILAFGAAFAIITVEQMFGDFGQNFVNPVLAGRCFLLTSFAKYMNNFASKLINPDTTTDATPLAVTKIVLKADTPVTTDVNLFQLSVGHIPSTIGEVSAITLLLGAAYLLWGKTISFEIPVIYTVTIAIFMFTFGEHSPNCAFAQVLGGGLIFGAFFMATDYASTPLTKKGQMIYAVIIGTLTGLFRIFGTGAEGVSYSIIIDNMLSSLIEGATIPKAFGRREAKKARARQKRLHL